MRRLTKFDIEWLQEFARRINTHEQASLIISNNILTIFHKPYVGIYLI